MQVGPDAGPDVPAGRTVVLRGGPSASNNGLPARVPQPRLRAVVFATAPSLPSRRGPDALSRLRLRAGRQASPWLAHARKHARGARTLARSLSSARDLRSDVATR